MRQLALILTLVFAFGGISYAQKGKAAPKKEMSCGEMMAAKAALPKKLAELMAVAFEGLDAHVKLLAAAKGDAKAQAEAKALAKVAKGHKAMGDAATKVAADMEAMKELPSSPEVEKTADMAKMMEGMQKQIALMKELGKMMTDEAKKGEQMMKAAKAAAKKAPKK
jgi:hypothetical protein